MSAPIILRDEKLMRALTTEPEGEMSCERCSMSLLKPAPHGVPRKINHARCEYLELPGYGGEKHVSNIALLCGQCKHDFLKARAMWMVFPQQFIDWCDAYVGVAPDPEEDIAEAMGEWEREEKPAARSKSKERKMPPQTMTREEFVKGEKKFVADPAERDEL